MGNNNLTASLEDYLEIIFNRINDNGAVKAVDISRDLNVSRASVTEALHKLAEKKYINYGRYASISITNTGIEKAKEIINKHNVIQSFFEQVLGIDKKESTETACKIEHVISKNILNRLLEFNKYCSNNQDFLDNFVATYSKK